MRTFDLAPLYRSTVGFDRLFSLLDQGIEGGAPGYPPYNIERTGENEYRVTVAVAGFSEPELSVVAKENTLTIRVEKNARRAPSGLHRGEFEFTPSAVKRRGADRPSTATTQMDESRRFFCLSTVVNV